MPDPGPGQPPRHYSDVAELLAGVTERTALDDVPGKSGARLERVVIGGHDYILKHLDPSVDWTMRASGSLRGVSLELYERGILARLPACLNQPIVGAAPRQCRRGAEPGGGTGWPPGCVLLMHDVAPWLIPATDEPLPLAPHLAPARPHGRDARRVLGGGPEIDVVPVMHRYLELSPWTALAESFMRSATVTHLVPQLIAPGLAVARAGSARRRGRGEPAGRRPRPAGGRAGGDPADVRARQLEARQPRHRRRGAHHRARLGKAGVGAPLSDLAWYLAINCRRLPQPKETAIEVYREALEDCGIDTGPWWDRQLALSLLGALVQFGWEKALGGYDDELAWWEAKAVQAAPLLR